MAIEPEAPEMLLDALYDQGQMGRRAYQCAINTGATTAGQIRHMPDSVLLEQPNCGLLTLFELRLLCGPIPPEANKQINKRRKMRMLWVQEVMKGKTDLGFDDWLESNEPK